jgi:hypothetical protein
MAGHCYFILTLNESYEILNWEYREAISTDCQTFLNRVRSNRQIFSYAVLRLIMVSGNILILEEDQMAQQSGLMHMNINL